MDSDQLIVPVAVVEKSVLYVKAVFEETLQTPFGLGLPSGVVDAQFVCDEGEVAPLAYDVCREIRCQEGKDGRVRVAFGGVVLVGCVGAVPKPW